MRLNRPVAWLAVSLGLAGCSSQRALYIREVKAELAKTTWDEAAPFTEESIAGLPEPVRRYFRACGWMGKKAPRNARFGWKELNLKRAKDKPWMPVHTLQFNSVKEPTRVVFMGGKLLKVLSFEGRDKFQDGHGHMLVKALGLFKVVDARSRRMDESGLVTVLAEALMVPSYALQPYMRWESLDSARARATLEWQGIKVDGIFHFTPNGECTRFETRSRWQEGKDAAPIPWSAYLEDYREKGGIRFMTRLRAVWHEPEGDFEYARGTIGSMTFDVREP